jgi:hypothetical protein
MAALVYARKRGGCYLGSIIVTSPVPVSALKRSLVLVRTREGNGCNPRGPVGIHELTQFSPDRAFEGPRSCTLGFNLQKVDSTIPRYLMYVL